VTAWLLGVAYPSAWLLLASYVVALIVLCIYAVRRRVDKTNATVEECKEAIREQNKAITESLVGTLRHQAAQIEALTQGLTQAVRVGEHHRENPVVSEVDNLEALRDDLISLAEELEHPPRPPAAGKAAARTRARSRSRVA
jgi:uncharacterized protein YoxC